MADSNSLSNQLDKQASQTPVVDQTGGSDTLKPKAIHLNPNFFPRDIVKFHQQQPFRNLHYQIPVRQNYPNPRFHNFPRPRLHHNQEYQSFHQRYHYNRFQPVRHGQRPMPIPPHARPPPYFHFQDPSPRFHPPFHQNLNQGPSPNFHFRNDYDYSYYSSNPEFFNPITPNNPTFMQQSQLQTETRKVELPEPEPEQYVGPTYYEAYNDLDDLTLPNEYNPTDVSSAQNYQDFRRKSRSESSYSHTSRSRRSRSRSKSCGSVRSRSNSSSVSSRSYTKESVSSFNCSSSWNSDSDRNSDSDLDLSKPLEPLTEISSNSKLLLKDIFKCLGHSKLKSMIPLELKGIGKKELLSLCKNLLDEMDSEHVIQIMKGDVSNQHETETESVSATATETTESDTNTSHVSDTSVKIKNLKRKRRKQIKNLKVTSKDIVVDSDESSTSSIPVVSTTTSLPSSTINQSLLELIQIEYKAKAINVMLTNLGVASDITSMISNALSPVLGHQSKSSQPQLGTTDLVDGKQVNVSNLEVNQTSGLSSSKQELPSNELQTKMGPSGNEKPCHHNSELMNNSVSSSGETNDFVATTSFNKDSHGDASETVKTSEHTNMELEAMEYKGLKSFPSPDFLTVDSDVLDLDISSHEKLKLPDDI